MPKFEKDVGFLPIDREEFKISVKDEKTESIKIDEVVPFDDNTFKGARLEEYLDFQIQAEAAGIVFQGDDITVLETTTVESLWLEDGANVYRDSGRVGIGKKPNHKLDVGGNGNFDGWVNAKPYYSLWGQRILHVQGDDNLWLGFDTGTLLSTASKVVVLGKKAGYNLTSGSKSVLAGYQAGDTLTIGTGLLILGYDADVSVNNLNYGIGLGYEALITASYQMVIGGTTGYINDVYLGTGVTSATPQAVAINASGGSGTDIAGADLTIASGKATGNAACGEMIFKTSDVGASGTTLQSLTEKVRIDSVGAVLIGGGTKSDANCKVEVFHTAWPVFRGHRTTNWTNIPAAGIDFLHETTGNMADGFGGAFTMSIKDATSSIYQAASVCGIRDGADDSGAIQFNVYSNNLRQEVGRFSHSETLHVGSTAQPTSMIGGINIATKTAPSASSANTFQFYSSDFAAGNACPTFRTENGTVIQLNQSLLTTDSPTFDDLTISTPVNIYALSHDSFTDFLSGEHFTMLDEDNMVTDSDTQCATQQSVKAYVDTSVATYDEFIELTDTPGAYAGEGGKILVVNATPNAVEFTASITGTRVELDEIGTATYDDIQDWINGTQGAGTFTGCLITEASALDGTVDISLGSGFLKASDSAIASTKYFSITATSSFAVDTGLNYLYIYDNSGTPTVAKTSSPATIDYRTKIPIGLVQKGSAGHVHMVNTGLRAEEYSKQNTRRVGELRGAERVSGMVTTVSTNNTLGLDVTAGVCYHAMARIATNQVDTGDSESITGVDQGNKQFTVAADWTDMVSHGKYITVTGSTGNDGVYAVETVTYAAPTSTITVEEAIPDSTVDGNLYGQTFKYYYRAAGSGWTPVNGNYQLDNVYWDDGTGTLNDLTANRYGVHWVFLSYDGHLLVLYGQGDYTLAQAEDAALPASLPNLPAYFSIPIAKIILQKSEADLANGTITTPFEVSFARGSVVNHSDLGGLTSGDDHTQYILHSLADAASDFLVASGANTYIKKTLAETGAILEGDIQHDNLQGITANEHLDWTNETNNFLTTGTLSCGVATLADASTLASSAAPSVDAEIANKKYVDDTASGVAGHAILDGTVHTDSVADAVSRGSVMIGNSTPKWDELTIGANTFVLTSDGTDISWAANPGAAHAVLDGSTHNDTAADAVSRGSIIVGNLTPAWDELTIGSATHVLTSDGTDISWQANPGAAHALLDGSTHNDTVADVVTRGSIVYGNATPAWDELVIGAADTFLGSDGTDALYRTAAQVLASLSGDASAAFDWNGQDLTNGGVVFLTEQAAAEADVAGKGQIWVKTGAPNTLWFTNEDGTDAQLGAGGGGAHAILDGSTHNDSVADVVTRGSIIYGNATPKWDELVIGSNTHVLTSDGTDISWAAPAGGVSTWVGLTDTPGSFTGPGEVWVNAAENALVISGNKNPDVVPTTPDADDDEFEGGGAIDGMWTIVNDPGIDQTTHEGYLYCIAPEEAASTTFDNMIRIYQTPPTGTTTWEIVIKVAMSAYNMSTDVCEWANVGPYLGNSTDDEWVQSAINLTDISGDLYPLRNSGYRDNGAGAITETSPIWSCVLTPTIFYYLKLAKTTALAYTAENTYQMSFSANGLIWQDSGEVVKTFTTACDEMGIIFRPPKSQAGVVVTHNLVDFFRKVA